MTPPPRRFPDRVYSRGSEPDGRFSLANERTFLAWIRTSLALIAGGVALEMLGTTLQPGLRVSASVLLVTLGIAASSQAWFGWARTETALREMKPLPSSRSALPLAAGVLVAAVLVLLGVVFA